ncbi:hypothetical protein F2Q69_00049557 [Brassica cretica]|uniref:Uncharacterized protein n=1 Tax=Brassica cretica TaxID=69181 RepID=A0A8S9Q0S4_BRACR|nr:hypothetical protein F2Q69_00049557 [Brassica cretica]
MRCKRHTVDLTSTVGVCASCLHERLLSLAASIAVEENNNHRLSRKSSNPPPPLPRSDAGGGGGDLGVSGKDFESKGGSVSSISNPFRARSDSNPKWESSSSSSRSWISSFLSTGRSKKQPAIDDVISGCRGMSPARDTGAEDGNEVPSGSIEETPGRTRRTPAVKTPGRRKIMTGMGFCLSPLVRARPNCPFKRKSRFPSEFVGNAGEVTAAEKPHISEAASFCANRSKKLADLGEKTLYWVAKWFKGLKDLECMLSSLPRHSKSKAKS